jgi:apolipoprotein N-acyltransferase
LKFVKQTIRQQVLETILPLSATALLLTVIQPPLGLSALAWFSVVPFVLASSPGARLKPLFIAAYVVAFFYWLGNLYWIIPVTVIGWVGICVYMAILWPVMACSLRYCRTKNIPMVLAVPIIFVGAERLQGVFLGGFFWRFLAHSQYANITIIQIADIFGAAGVSLLVGMVNGLLAEFIIVILGKKKIAASHFAHAALVCAVIIAAIFYGRWRIAQSERIVVQGPVVAAVQSNVPQSVKRSGEASDVILSDILKDSRAAAAAGAKLIVWPETMVQALLNRDVWPYLASPYAEECKTFDIALGEHTRDTAYLLVGAYGAQVETPNNAKPYLRRYNSAFFYTPQGRQAMEWYSKIHLVLFGEVVPFYRTFPALYKFLMSFTPYNYDYSLNAGTEYTVFTMTADNQTERKTHSFSVMICYEDTIPSIARTFALDDKGHKRVDWLVNISNDGWFVRFVRDKTVASAELPQHAAVCAFRAVENRLAVIRSVNTGISCIIDSLGRIRDGYMAGSLPPKALERTGTAGWFVDKVPIDKRVTFFSRYGQWLDFGCAASVVLTIIGPLLKRLLKPGGKRVSR